ERKALGEKNKKEEEKFLAANRKKKGVKSLPSGLQYRVLKRGNGRSPRVTDKVSVHYRGTLIDGTEFENSYENGQPVELPIQNFIPGCKEALPLMREGDKWELVVPSRLAFAEQGDPRNAVIGPNAALLYEIELVAVVSGTNRSAAQ
ncbi:MAG: FKBP-type peptidyl-prolyl cis-trans isomerase, partial [Pirellulales bacterium]